MWVRIPPVTFQLCGPGQGTEPLHLSGPNFPYCRTLTVTTSQRCCENTLRAKNWTPHIIRAIGNLATVVSKDGGKGQKLTLEIGRAKEVTLWECRLDW